MPVDLDGERVTQVRFGDVGRRMLVGMHRAIAAFAAAGSDVIVDDLFLEPDTLDDYLRTRSMASMCCSLIAQTSQP